MFQKKLPITFLTLLILSFAATPAFANEPMIYGFYTAVAPAAISKTTWGVAGILIIAIESWFFRHYWQFTWRRAILFTIGINLWSTFIGGLIAAFMFSSSFFYLPMIIGIPILFSVLLIRHEPPGWFYILTVMLFLLGSVVSVPASFIIDPQPKLLLLAYIEVPLVTGFALTLWIESLVIRHKSDKYEFWNVITKANVASYILLLFLFPFFAPNPYTMKSGDWVISRVYKPGSYYAKGDIGKVIEFLHMHRASTTQLLGITDPDRPPENYDADFEIGFLEKYSAQSHSFSLKDLRAITEDTLSLSTLTPEASGKLRWLDQFFTYFEIAKEMIDKNDQDGLNQIYSKWVYWQDKTDYPGTLRNKYAFRSSEDDKNFKMLGDFPHPSYLIGQMIGLKESELRIPGQEAMIQEHK